MKVSKEEVNDILHLFWDWCWKREPQIRWKDFVEDMWDGNYWSTLTPKERDDVCKEFAEHYERTRS